MALVASCFILSFRAITWAWDLSWFSLECDLKGILDKGQGKTQFTKIAIKGKLVITNAQSTENAERLLNKAEQSCLLSNSLKSESLFECEVIVE